MNTSRKPVGYSKDAGGISAAAQSVSNQRPVSASVSSNPWTKPLPYALYLSGRRRSDILCFNKVIWELNDLRTGGTFLKTFSVFA